MRVIHKLALAQQTIMTYELPAGADVRYVASQYGDDITLWYEFDESDERVLVRRTFAIVGTGHREVVNGWTFVGTAILREGQFVFHVYEV